MSKLRIGVLRGGTSNEYDVSLQSGQNIIDNLADGYEVSDILITKDGEWNIDGCADTPVSAMRRNDLFFNALHGSYGEDGKLQQYLDAHRFAYTGSGKLASALAMNKLLTKKRLLCVGLKTPRYVLPEEDLYHYTERVIENLPVPWVVKPTRGGSSIGVRFAYTREDLFFFLQDFFEKGEPVFVEEAIMGREATVGVVDNFRNALYYPLPPMEIIPPVDCDFFDHEAKYSGRSEEIPYGSFSLKEINKIKEVALEAHQALGLSHYSRTDLIVTNAGEMYVLEVNTLPGLSRESLLPKSLEKDNIPICDFLDHIIGCAIKCR